MEISATRTAVVTGGSRGIGLAIAEDLLADGWSVVSVSRTGGDRVDGRLRSVAADLSTSAGISRCIEHINGAVTRVELLVNNAGEIGEAEQIMDVSEAAMTASWRLHALAPLLVTRGLLDLLNRADNPAVINIGSVYGIVADPDVTAYGSAKCGLGYLTKALAVALAPHVRVNVVLPGHVDTQMTRSAPREYLDEVLADIPFRRFASVTEIVKVVRFLASNDATFVTGASLTVDGGFMSPR
jgi:3-oxoacyl-[acyl-carrier protein] reductase